MWGDSGDTHHHILPKLFLARDGERTRLPRRTCAAPLVHDAGIDVTVVSLSTVIHPLSNEDSVAATAERSAVAPFHVTGKKWRASVRQMGYEVLSKFVITWRSTANPMGIHDVRRFSASAFLPVRSLEAH